MADFAPKANFDIGYEQPVTTSSASAIANIGTGLANIFSQTQAKQAEPIAGVDPALFRGLVDGLEQADAIKSDNPTQAALMERTVLQNYLTSSGARWTTEVQSMVEQQLGRPIELLGKTEDEIAAEREQTRRQELLEQPQFQTFIREETRLNPNMDQEELFRSAETRYNAFNDAATILEEQALGRQVNWERQGRGAAITFIESFQEVSLGGILDKIEANQPISQNEIRVLQTQWTAAKGRLLSQPDGVKDAQYQGVQDRISSVDGIFETLLTLTDPGQIESSQMGWVRQMLLPAPGQEATATDIQSVIMVMSNQDLSKVLSGETTSIPSIGAGTPGVDAQAIRDYYFLRMGEVARNQIVAAMPTQADGTVDTSGTITFEQLDNDTRSAVEGLSPAQIVSTLEGENIILGRFTDNDMNSPESANAYTGAAMRVGAVLLGANEILDPSFVDKLGIGADFGAQLDAIAALGTADQDEAMSRMMLRSGLSLQSNLYTKAIQSIEGSNPFTGRGMVVTHDPATNSYYIKGDDRQWQTVVGIEPGRLAALKANTNFDPERGLRIDLNNLPVLGRGPVGDLLPSLQGNLIRGLEFHAALGKIDAAVASLTPEPPLAEGEIRVSTLPPAFNLPQEVAQDTDFVQAANSVASNIGIDVGDLFRVIEFETAGSWSPSIKAPTSSATGLIQFIESTAQGLGTSTAELATMTRAEQMQYVEKYLEPYKGRINNFGDLYMAIHWPAGVGKSDNYVMYERGSDAYNANRGLDTNGDGTVTRGETLGRVLETVGQGRGVMTTPNTAAAESLLGATGEQLIPPSTPTPTTMRQTPVQPVEAPTVTDVAQETTTPFQGGGQAATPQASIPQDVQNALIAIASGEQPSGGVVSFSNYEDFKRAVDAGEIAKGQWVILEGRAIQV